MTSEAFRANPAPSSAPRAAESQARNLNVSPAQVREILLQLRLRKAKPTIKDLLDIFKEDAFPAGRLWLSFPSQAALAHALGIDEPQASKLLSEERHQRRGSGLFLVSPPDQPLKIVFQADTSFWRLPFKKKDERRMREAREQIREAADPEEQFLRSTLTGSVPTQFSPPDLRQTVSEEAIRRGSCQIDNSSCQIHKDSAPRESLREKRENSSLVGEERLSAPEIFARIEEELRQTRQARFIPQWKARLETAPREMERIWRDCLAFEKDEPVASRAGWMNSRWGKPARSATERHPRAIDGRQNPGQVASAVLPSGKGGIRDCRF